MYFLKTKTRQLKENSLVLFSTVIITLAIASTIISLAIIIVVIVVIIVGWAERESGREGERNLNWNCKKKKVQGEDLGMFCIHFHLQFPPYILPFTSQTKFKRRLKQIKKKNMKILWSIDTFFVLSVLCSLSVCLYAFPLMCGVQTVEKKISKNIRTLFFLSIFIKME